MQPAQLERSGPDMRVALTMRVTGATDYIEPRDSISQDWIRMSGFWDMTPFPVPNIGREVAKWFSQIKPEFLILTGGGDPKGPGKRNETERRLLEIAVQKRIPVLGVCRGFQFLNIYFGGEVFELEGHVGSFHDVSVSPEWQRYYGERVMVNSYHNLGIRKEGLAKDLIPAANDCDGNIEASYHNTLPIAAVMWHPERAGAPAADRNLFCHIAGKGERTG